MRRLCCACARVARSKIDQSQQREPIADKESWEWCRDNFVPCRGFISGQTPVLPYMADFDRDLFLGQTPVLPYIADFDRDAFSMSLDHAIRASFCSRRSQLSCLREERGVVVLSMLNWTGTRESYAVGKEHCFGVGENAAVQGISDEAFSPSFFLLPPGFCPCPL